MLSVLLPIQNGGTLYDYSVSPVVINDIASIVSTTIQAPFNCSCQGVNLLLGGSSNVLLEAANSFNVYTSNASDSLQLFRTSYDGSNRIDVPVLLISSDFSSNTFISAPDRVLNLGSSGSTVSLGGLSVLDAGGQTIVSSSQSNGIYVPSPLSVDNFTATQSIFCFGNLYGSNLNVYNAISNGGPVDELGFGFRINEQLQSLELVKYSHFSSNNQSITRKIAEFGRGQFSPSDSSDTSYFVFDALNGVVSAINDINGCNVVVVTGGGGDSTTTIVESASTPVGYSFSNNAMYTGTLVASNQLVAPAFTFGSGGGAVYYSASCNVIVVEAGGGGSGTAPAICVSAQTGAVGIQNWSPQYPLDVRGAINLNSLFSSTGDPPSSAELLLLVDSVPYSVAAIGWSVSAASNVVCGCNVGIGTTEPTEALHVVGSTLTSGGQFIAADSLCNVSFAFGDDPQTGMGRPAASGGALALFCAGAQVLGLTCNAATVAAPLVVRSSSSSVGGSNGSSSNPGICMASSSNSVNIVLVESRDADDLWLLSSNLSLLPGDAVIQNSNAESRLLLQVGAFAEAPGVCIAGPSNFVGLGGNARPQYALDVAGDVNLSGALRVNGVAFSFQETPWAYDASNGAIFATSEHAVGLGTSNPAAALHIAAGGGLLVDSGQCLIAGDRLPGGTPSLAFDTDHGTGLFQPDVGELGFCASGSSVAQLGAALAQFQVPLSVQGDISSVGDVRAQQQFLGGAAASNSSFSNVVPAFAFLADSNSGLALSGTSDQLALVTSGFFSVETSSSNSVSVNAPQLLVAGTIEAEGRVLAAASASSSTAPAYSFLGDSNTGLFHSVVGELGLCASGSSVAQLGAALAQFQVPLSVQGDISSVGDVRAQQQFLGGGAAASNSSFSNVVPAFAFLADSNSGLALNGTSGQLALVTSGFLSLETSSSNSVSVNAPQLLVAGTIEAEGRVLAAASASSSTAPAYSFLGDSNTGLFHSVVGELGVCASGSSVAQLGAALAQFQVPVSVQGDISSVGDVRAQQQFLGGGAAASNSSFSNVVPAFAFLADSNSGLALSGTSDQLALVTSGFLSLETSSSNSVSVNAPQLLVAGTIEAEGRVLAAASASSSTAPAYSFLGDSNTGLFHSVVGELGVCASGSPVAQLGAALAQFQVPVSVQGDISCAGPQQQPCQFLGSASSNVVPAFAFLADSNSGLALGGTSGELALVTSGFLSVETSSSNSVSVNAPQLLVAGTIEAGGRVLAAASVVSSSAAPAFSFLGDSNTGLFHSVVGELGVCASGSSVAQLGAALAQFQVPLSVQGDISSVGDVRAQQQFLGGAADSSFSNVVPAFAFLADSNSGLALSGTSDQLALVTSGFLSLETSSSNSVSVNAPQLLVAGTIQAGGRVLAAASASSSTAPAYSFTGDSNTGLFHSVVGELGICASGSSVAQLGAALAQFQVPLSVQGDISSVGDVRAQQQFLGGAADSSFSNVVPAFAFLADSNSGLALSGTSDQLALVTSGFLSLETSSSNSVSVNAPQLLVAGTIQAGGRVLAAASASSSTAPAYSFTGDSNTGLFHSVVGELGVCASGSSVAQLGAALAQFQVPVSVQGDISSVGDVRAQQQFLGGGAAAASNSSFSNVVPAFAFLADSNSGLALNGTSGQLALVTSGFLSLETSSSNSVSVNAPQLLAPATTIEGARFAAAGPGTSNAPAFFFANKNSGGIFFSSNGDVVSVAAAGGTLCASFASNVASFCTSIQLTAQDQQFLASSSFPGFTTPAYSFAADTGTGVFQPAPGALAVATSASAEVLRVTPDGHVGIGTETPTATLHVNGTFEAAGAATFEANVTSSDQFLAGVAAQNDPAHPAYSFAADSNTGMYWAGPGGVGFACAGSQVLALLPTGMTTASPLIAADAPVVVAPGYQFLAPSSSSSSSSSSSLPGFSFLEAPSCGMSYCSATASLTLRAGDGSGGGLTASSNLTSFFTDVSFPYQLLGGGGEDFPAYAFAGDCNTGMFHAGWSTVGFAAAGSQVLAMSPTSVDIAAGVAVNAAASVACGGQFLSLSSNSASEEVPAYSFWDAPSTGMHLLPSNAAVEGLAFCVDATDVVSVTCDGLEVSGQITATSGLLLKGSAGTAEGGGASLNSGSNATLYTNNNFGVGTSCATYPVQVAATSASGVSVYVAGDVVSFSDARAKTDVRPITDAMAKVGKLGGYTFRVTHRRCGDADNKLANNGSGSSSTGVIAQEVLDVLPEAVYEDAEGMYCVAYGNMVGLLIEAVKELGRDLLAVKAEISAWKTKGKSGSKGGGRHRLLQQDV